MIESFKKIRIKKEAGGKQLHRSWIPMNKLRNSKMRTKNNSNITKSKILMRRSFGSLKIGFFSDTGFRNFEINSD